MTSAERLAALATPAGQALRREARDLLAAARAAAAAGRGRVDPMAVTADLRRAHPDADPALVAEALTQAELAAAARSRLGADSDRMLLTRTGLEQATRSVVADRRAARLAAAGAQRVADLGCGLGLDALALARAGLEVTAVERDPLTAAAARANAALVPGRIAVRLADATEPDVLDELLTAVDAAFVDPARRAAAGPQPTSGGRVPPERDPGRWSPPWDWVRALARRFPRTVAKVAPGLPLSLVPDGAEVEWVSVDGDLVEACVWFAGLAAPGVRRRATVLGRDGAVRTLTRADEPGPERPVGEVGAWLLEADPAVERADLVPDLARTLGARTLDRSGPWLTGDGDVPSAATGRAYTVLDDLPAQPRRLRAALRERGIGSVTVKARGGPAGSADLRGALRLDGAGTHGTLVVARTPAGTRTLLVAATLPPGDPLDG